MSIESIIKTLMWINDEAKKSKRSPAIQAVMKLETLPAIRALKAQLAMSFRLSGAKDAGKRTTLC